MHCIANAHSIRRVQQASAQFAIDLMHMMSQKGAPACWGSNEALSRAPSPSMQPAGQPLHDDTAGFIFSRPGPAHWLRGWERQRSSSTTRARSATSLDPQHAVVVMETWRQCIRSIWNELQDVFACPWNPSYSHSAEHHMRGGEGISILQLVSVPQTRSSMVGFNMRQCHTVTSPASLILWREKKYTWNGTKLLHTII